MDLELPEGQHAKEFGFYTVVMILNEELIIVCIHPRNIAELHGIMICTL